MRIEVSMLYNGEWHSFLSESSCLIYWHQRRFERRASNRQSPKAIPKDDVIRWPNVDEFVMNIIRTGDILFYKNMTSKIYSK